MQPAVNNLLDTITGNTANLGADLLAVGGAGIAVAAGVWGLRKGWKYFRSMV